MISITENDGNEPMLLLFIALVVLPKTTSGKTTKNLCGITDCNIGIFIKGKKIASNGVMTKYTLFH